MSSDQLQHRGQGGAVQDAAADAAAGSTTQAFAEAPLGRPAAALVSIAPGARGSPPVRRGDEVPVAGHDSVVFVRDGAGGALALAGDPDPNRLYRADTTDRDLTERERLALLEATHGNALGGRRSVPAGGALTPVERERLRELEGELTEADRHDESLPLDAWPAGQRALVRTVRKNDAQDELSASLAEEGAAGEAGRNARRGRIAGRQAERIAAGHTAEAARLAATAQKRAARGDAKGAARADARAKDQTRKAETARAAGKEAQARFKDAAQLGRGGTQAAKLRQQAKRERERGEQRAKRQEEAGDGKGAAKTRADSRDRADKLDGVASKVQARREAAAERAKARREAAKKRAEQRKTEAKRRGPSSPAESHIIDVSDPEGPPVFLAGTDKQGLPLSQAEIAQLEDMRRYERIHQNSLRHGRGGVANVANYPAPVFGTPGAPVDLDGAVALQGYQFRALQGVVLASHGDSSYKGTLGATATETPTSPPATHLLASDRANTSVASAQPTVAVVAGAGAGPGLGASLGFGTGFGVGADTASVLLVARADDPTAARLDARPLVLLHNDLLRTGSAGAFLEAQSRPGTVVARLAADGTYTTRGLVTEALSLGSVDPTAQIHASAWDVDADGNITWRADAGTAVALEERGGGLYLVEYADDGDETSATLLPGASSTFLALSDTPNSYVGEAGKVVAVNLAETGLEFVAAGGTPPFVDSTPLVKGSADPTRLLRYELDTLITSGMTRVRTEQDMDGSPALQITTGGALRVLSCLSDHTGGDAPHELRADNCSEINVGALRVETHRSGALTFNPGNVRGPWIEFRTTQPTVGQEELGKIEATAANSDDAGSGNWNCTGWEFWSRRRFDATSAFAATSVAAIEGRFQHSLTIRRSGLLFNSAFSGWTQQPFSDWVGAADPIYPTNYVGLYGAVNGSEVQIRYASSNTVHYPIAGSGTLASAGMATATGQQPLVTSVSFGTPTYTNIVTVDPTYIAGGKYLGQVDGHTFLNLLTTDAAVTDVNAAGESGLLMVESSPGQLLAKNESGRDVYLTGATAGHWWETAATAAAIRTLFLRASSSGTPAAGFGVRLEFQAEDAATNVDQVVAQLDAVYTDPTNGSEDGALATRLVDAGTVRETARHEANRSSWVGPTGGTYQLTRTSQQLTATAGTTLTFSGTPIPDGALQYGVTLRIDTGLGTTAGLTSVELGDGTDQDRWGVLTAPGGVTAGNTLSPPNYTSDANPNTLAAINPVLTAIGGTGFDGTGLVTVETWWVTVTAPTS
jgi:histone H1/5